MEKEICKNNQENSQKKQRRQQGLQILNILAPRAMSLAMAYDQTNGVMKQHRMKRNQHKDVWELNVKIQDAFVLLYTNVESVSQM